MSPWLIHRYIGIKNNNNRKKWIIILKVVLLAGWAKEG
jgi:hypothetical protein